MTIPLAQELQDSIKELGISSVHTSLGIKIHLSPGCVACRNELLESEDKPGYLTNGTFWKVSPKYRFDLLAWDIPKIADNLSLSIGIAHIYLPHVAAHITPPYQPTVVDDMFWYAIENGFRVASSGWDRIALLLDLVLKLGVGQYCNYKKVIDRLKNRIELNRSVAFGELKAFRDEKFVELEGSLGEGFRHEATHLITTNTRFTMEVLEKLSIQKPEIRLTPLQAHKMLIAHYGYYINGVNCALKLIDTTVNQS